ncbi:hypothetical protein A3F65_02350 [Candidatus Saccharibacteria bacterium RIFCSPHIGHO2_12_FULL_47_16b]|nr:MAG: hypothetical protein A3F65_02350 [Candidatus Saccharibacteria bacterium RIFCSPHIGHO2_12_FULL_47_16b]OGL37899.1 MAG: hypothetical protein A3J32_02550 [Candidatus Saccharibacteria bacterium RIFCSPLOWO2_02_FULL_46_7]
MAIFPWEREEPDEVQASGSTAELFLKNPAQRADFHSNALASPTALAGITDPLAEKTDLLKSESPVDVFGLPTDPTKTTGQP